MEILQRHVSQKVRVQRYASSLFLKNVTVWNKSPFDVFFIISMIYLYIGLFREGLKGFDLSCWQENELINYSPLNWKSYVSYPASNRISPLASITQKLHAHTQ